jgi:hypothetical protein
VKHSNDRAPFPATLSKVGEAIAANVATLLTASASVARIDGGRCAERLALAGRAAPEFSERRDK